MAFVAELVIGLKIISPVVSSSYHTIIMIHTGMYLMLKLVCHKVQYWDRYISAIYK